MLLQWIALVGWLIAASVNSAVVFGLYRYVTDPEYILPKSARIIYNGFANTAWGIGIAWVIFACHFGYGGTP
jgi:hypothetical protein